MSMKNISDTIGNRTGNLLACSTVPQPTAPTRAVTGGTWIKFHAGIMKVSSSLTPFKEIHKYPKMSHHSFQIPPELLALVILIGC
jgi:hypothetical protein